MNGCDEVRDGLTEYLDGRLTGRGMQEIDAHLEVCRDCAREWNSMRQLQASLTELGPVPEPADLALRIRRTRPSLGAESCAAGWSLASPSCFP